MRLWLPCLALLASIGCAAEQAAPAPDDGSGENADDLIDVQQTIQPGQLIEVTIPGEYLVEPRVTERANDILIETTDLRIRQVQGRFEVALVNDPSQKRVSSYAFMLDWLRDDGVWQDFGPLGNSPDWYWERLTFETIASHPETGRPTIMLSGDGVKYTDELLGVDRSAEHMRVDKLQWDAFLTWPTVRILVVPVWNFWEWDHDGYAATVTFRSL